MRYILLFILTITIVYPSFAQDNIIHSLQVGDTLESLADTYDTCREAIIYQNDLTLTGIYAAYYIVDVGTELFMPSRSACKDLPMDRGYYTVTAGETVAELMAKYRYPYAQLTQLEYGPDGNSRGEIHTPITPDTELVGGEVLIIYPMIPFYTTTQELLVIDDTHQFEPTEHILKTDDTLASLAEIYQTCREAIIWENQLMLQSDASQFYVFDEGDTLMIPPAPACDDVPFGQYTITTEERVTQNTLMRRYQQFDGMYYGFNTPQEGLLPVGTEQVIPSIEYMFWNAVDIRVLSAEDETYPIAYSVEKGDSFTRLAETFGTCVEAIRYANENLVRTSASDPTFKILAGAEILIPSPAVCDAIPTDPIIHVVEEGDTLWGISYQYNTTIDTIIQASVDSPESQLSRDADSPLMKNANLIEPGLKVVIPDGSRQYKLKFEDRLFVYDDDDMIVNLPLSLSLNEIAMCYGADWDLSEVNGLRDVQYTGGSLIIPNPQHDCILHNYAHPDGVLACYPHPLELIAGLPNNEPLPTSMVVEEVGAYCYGIPQVYEALFHDQSVIFYDAQPYRRAGKDEMWGLDMAMITYCLHDHPDLLRDIRYDNYDATVIPPDDDIRVFAVPDDLNCNREMFNDYYMYMVQLYDRLGSIAKAYGTHPDLIAQANNLENPNIIYWGQYLKIPTPTLPHLLQGVGALIAVFISGWGLRRGVFRRTQKSKRKPKE